MDLFEFNSFESSSDSSDASFDDDLELEMFEDQKRPKNENYIENTVENFSESEFIEHFRMSRHVANTIAEQYEESNLFNPQSGGNGKISAKHQVYLFLWFAGHEAASFRDVSDRFAISISSLFRINRRLIYFLSNLAPQTIKWPDFQEKQEIEQFFRNKNFPGVIGLIDGSHIRIDKPTGDPDSYYNRKKYFSIQATQAAISEAFKTPEVIRLFGRREPKLLRERLKEIEEQVRLNYITKEAGDNQKVEILTALRQLNNQLSREELQFLEKHNGTFKGLQNIEFLEVKDN